MVLGRTYRSSPPRKKFQCLISKSAKTQKHDNETMIKHLIVYISKGMDKCPGGIRHKEGEAVLYTPPGVKFA